MLVRFVFDENQFVRHVGLRRDSMTKHCIKKRQEWELWELWELCAGSAGDEQLTCKTIPVYEPLPICSLFATPKVWHIGPIRRIGPIFSFFINRARLKSQRKLINYQSSLLCFSP
jgi:hypothetical protein